MEFDWDKFIKAYQAAPKESCLLIDSGIIADCVQNVTTSDSTAPKYHSLLITALSHHVLGTTPQNEIVKILEAAGITNPITLLAKAIGCLETKSAREENALQTEILAAEHDLASLHSVRTMSHDMAAIKPGSDVVYQSSQADILQTPTVTPPATVIDTPRWDTDTRK